MQAKDIEIGSEYAYHGHGIVARVRVTRKGLRMSSYTQAKSGVEVEVIEFATFAGRKHTVPPKVETRKIEPWGQAHQAQMERWRAENALSERVARISARLGTTAALAPGTTSVRIYADEYIELAERLGVSTD